MLLTTPYQKQGWGRPTTTTLKQPWGVPPYLPHLKNPATSLPGGKFAYPGIRHTTLYARSRAGEVAKHHLHLENSTTPRLSAKFDTYTTP